MRDRVQLFKKEGGNGGAAMGRDDDDEDDDEDFPEIALDELLDEMR